VRARLGIATAVALALAGADLAVKAALPADPALTHHRTQAWMALSFGLFVLVLVVTRLPSWPFALGAGVLAGGLGGNLGSALLHHRAIANPLVAGGFAFNLADTFIISGVLLIGASSMQLALRYRHLLPTHTIPVRIARRVIAHRRRLAENRATGG
jgi:hypothetical protein